MQILKQFSLQKLAPIHVTNFFLKKISALFINILNSFSKNVLNVPVQKKTQHQISI